MPLPHPGDIGCVADAQHAHERHALDQGDPVRLPQIQFPERRSRSPVKARARHDEEKLQQGIHRLHDEDLTFETTMCRRPTRR